MRKRKSITIQRPIRCILMLAGVVTFLFLAGLSSASAQTLFFDANQADNTYTGNTNPWDSVTTDWRNNGNTANVAWTAGNTASFQIFRGYVSLAVAESATGLQFTNNNGGYRVFGAGALTLTGGATAISLLPDGFSARVENNLTLTAASTFTNTAGGVLYVTGNITAANLGLTIAGNGEVDLTGVVGLGSGALTTNSTGTVLLTNANTYTGGTVINNGTVKAQNATALGTAAGAVSLNGGKLEIDNVTVANNINAATGTTLTGTGTAQTNGVLTLAANASMTINTSSNASDVFTIGSAANSLAGGTAAVSVITINGNGRVILGTGGGVNSYLGDYELDGGVLQTPRFNALSNTATTLTFNGGTLEEVGNFNTPANKNFVFGAGGGTFNVVAGATANVLGSADEILGSGSFTKGNLGILTVQLANNTFTGSITVDGGTLSLSTATGTMTGATGVTVSGGGIMLLDSSGGNNNARLGTVPVTLQGGEFKMVGQNAAAGTAETFGAMTLNQGDSIVDAEIGGAAGSTQATFSKLTQNPAATVNFTNAAGGGTLGTAGLNPRVLFTANPALTNGMIGGWAYVNNTDFAGYTAANGVQTLAGARTNVINTSVAANNVLANAAQVALTANININSLLYTGTFNTDLNGHTLDIGTGGLMKTGNNALTISSTGGAGGLTAGAAAGAELFANIVANTTTISAPIINNAGGAIDLVKAGPGTLVLSGATANTYSGTTYVNEGEVQLNKTAGVNAIAGNVTVGDGAGVDTLQLLASNQIANTSAVTVLRSGDFDLNGNNQTIGSLTMEGGIAAGTGQVITGAGTLTLGGNVTLNTNAATNQSASITGNLSLGGATRTFTVGDNLLVQRDLNISAVISDGAASSGLTKAGAGTLTLSGATANTYSGTTTVNAGTLELNKTAGVNAVAGNITINTGGTMLLAASNQIADTANMTLAGGTFSTGGNSETLNNLTLTANSVIDMGAGASILKFSSTWTPNGNTLTIANWTGLVFGGGTDQIFFGNSQTLTTTQLGGITFLGYHPGAQQLADGEIVPIIPEATTVVGGFLLVAVIAWRERRRRRALV